jgi:hypothetical protein
LSSDFNQNFNLPPSFSKSPQNLISWKFIQLFFCCYLWTGTYRQS